MSNLPPFPDRDTRHSAKVAAISAGGIGLGALAIVAALPVLATLAGFLLLATIFFGAAANSDRSETKAEAFYPLAAVHYKSLPTYSAEREHVDTQAINLLNQGRTYTEVQVTYRDEAVLKQAPARLMAAGWTCELIEPEISPDVACDKAGHAGLGIYRMGKNDVLLITSSVQDSWTVMPRNDIMRANS